MPVLVYPDFEQNFILETDASLRGLGAVLSQMEQGLSHTVLYARRSLSSPEKNRKTIASASWKHLQWSGQYNITEHTFMDMKLQW